MPLDLGAMEQPASESALRAAYVRSELARYLSYEQAMSRPAYAIVIRNLAEALARRAASHRFRVQTEEH